MPAPTRSNKQKSSTTANCVLYARVSSKDQEHEGFSIPAQQRLLREYAGNNGLRIVQEFIDVETARRAGREGFSKMVTYLKKHEKSCQSIIVEKTDRLLRNLKDHATLEELHATMHFAKENVIISPDSKSAEKFVFGIKVLCAKQYSENLGEETKKGQVQKALSGVYPSFAPAGYQNVDGPNGKRIIIQRPSEATMIADLFNRFATGTYSLKSLVQDTRSRGITIRGRKLHSSTLHQILHKKIYYGAFDYDNKTYQGSHEPITTKETWDTVRGILDERKLHQTKAAKREFPFSGMITCGHCGCALVAELKKKRYVYYHCTGHRGKCPEPYTRQETLTNEFASTLGTLVIPTPILDWLANEINKNDQNEQGARETTRKRLEAEQARIQHRLSTLYEDRLDGTITKEQYETKAASLKTQREELQNKLEKAQEQGRQPLTTALDLTRLTSNACNQFREQNETEQRKLLTTILKKANWQNGKLHTTLLEPFEQLQRSNQLSNTKINKEGEKGRDIEIWLPR